MPGPMGIMLGILTVGASGGSPGVRLTLTSEDGPYVNDAFTVTATFSKAVTWFTVDSISATNATISEFAGSGKVYTFTVTPIAEGPVTLSVVALDYEYDVTAPTVAITSDASGTVTGPFEITITFSEPVVGFALDSLTVGNGTASNLATEDDTVFTATITPAEPGAVTVDIAADAVTDRAGNGNEAATQFSVTYSESFDFDFSALEDGALPAPLSGATWAIVSGKAINTPMLGAELLSDTSMEQPYSDGLCGSLTKQGTPSVSESVDAHSGAKAQQFQAVGPSQAVAQNKSLGSGWYQYSVWGKVLSGSAGTTGLRLFKSDAIPRNSALSRFRNTEWTQKTVSLVIPSAGTTLVNPAYAAAASDVVVVDDHSLRAISTDTIYALLPYTESDVVAKVQLAPFVDDTYIGLILRADAQSAPQHSIEVFVRERPENPAQMEIAVAKKILGEYSLVLAPQAANIVPGAWLEVRASGPALRILYNGTQIGDELIVDNEELVSNKYFGFFSTGGNSVNRFFLGHQLTDMSLVFAGSSFTQANPGYKAPVQQWLKTNHPQYAFTFESQAMGGRNSWSNLVKLQTGADVFIIDHANDSNDPVASPARRALEAIIRRLWTANPDTRIIIMGSPTWVGKDTSDNEQVHTPTNAAAIAQIKALAEHYGCGYVDYPQWCIDVVTAGTYDLNELTTDTVHPSNTAGYPGMAALLQEFLPLGGGKKPAVMPERLYDDGSYENEPVVILGTDYDSRTGTGWSDDGTATESSTEGDTITYSATCQSFGLRRLDGSDHTNLEISVDGGAWRNSACNANGEILPEGRGAHTITIRIKAGGNVRIDEFWAV